MCHATIKKPNSVKKPQPRVRNHLAVIPRTRPSGDPRRLTVQEDSVNAVTLVGDLGAYLGENIFGDCGGLVLRLGETIKFMESGLN